MPHPDVSDRPTAKDSYLDELGTASSVHFMKSDSRLVRERRAAEWTGVVDLTDAAEPE